MTSASQPIYAMTLITSLMRLPVRMRKAVQELFCDDVDAEDTSEKILQ